MKTVEEAYQAIGQALVKSGSGEWDEIVFETLILGGNCSSMKTSRFKGSVNESIGLGFENGFAVSDAVVYLRDDLLRMTGERIWGLTFTLYPTGKFKIEYDYNKPEGYEETDETINLSDAVDRLQKLGVEVQVTENKK